MRKPDSREVLRMALGTIVFAVIMVVLTGFQNGWHSLTTVRGVLRACPDSPMVRWNADLPSHPPPAHVDEPRVRHVTYCEQSFDARLHCLAVCRLPRRLVVVRVAARIRAAT